MEYNFLKIDLTEGERLWLGVISNQYLRGFRTDVNRLKKNLHSQGKWPKGLRPFDIDTRLIWEGNTPTLLGVWHVSPENAWIPKFDQMVKYLKERIQSSTSAKINVSDIAAALGLPIRSISTLIHLLPSVGLYYSATSTAAPRNRVLVPGEMGTFDSLQLDDPEIMEGYLSYEGIEEQMRVIYGTSLDVFVGFSESDKDIALKVQSLLKVVFGESSRVFVSSDKESMIPGDWFTHVVSNLKDAQVLLVLVSQNSNRKEWINYETGVAEGVAKHHDHRGFAQNILPIVIGGVSKNEVTGPIRHYQVSDLHNIDNLNWVLDQIARLIGRSRKEIDLEGFIQEVKYLQETTSVSISNTSEETPDERFEWQLLAEFTEPSKEGLILNPPTGSKEWKAAERLVSKGRLERLPNSMGYAIPGQRFKVR